jgi:Ca2+-binding EF-hand superfamily protein
MLHDELWPQWLIRDDKLNTAQNLFANMSHHLATVHGFSAEAAFALYDSKEDGAISHEQFMLIMNIFFAEILTENEIEFLTKLCVYRNDQKIFYREFCKFLDTRLVRTFKNVTIRSSAGEAELGTGNDDDKIAFKQKTPLELELEKPLKKEASISYVLRKAAELGKDLRREFQIHDPLELNVISRTQFWALISDMPLGLAEREVEDIFDHDLQFDNYGNVEYTHILQKEMFLALERHRLREKAQKKST